MESMTAGIGQTRFADVATTAGIPTETGRAKEGPGLIQFSELQKSAVFIKHTRYALVVLDGVLGPRRAPCQLKKPFKGPRSCGRKGREKCFPP